MLNSTNFQQIIVGNSGFGHPPPGVYVPIIIRFIIGILTDPLPPDRDDVTIFAVGPRSLQQIIVACINPADHCVILSRIE